MKSYGERQVGVNLDGIREDHKQRYLWARARMAGNVSVLDGGCGVGYGSRILSEKASHVTAIDISEETIEFARRYWVDDNIDFVNQDLLFLQFDDPQPEFRVAVFYECIEHLAAPELLLLRLRRHFTPDAQLFLSVPNQVVRPFHLHLNPYHFMHYTQADLKGLLARCGYTLVELASQDDGEVHPGTEGQFLVAQCALVPDDPELDLAALEAELPDRMQRHFSEMGAELAKTLEVRNDLNRSSERIEHAESQLSEMNKRLHEVDRERMWFEGIAEGMRRGDEQLSEMNKRLHEMDGERMRFEEIAEGMRRGGEQQMKQMERWVLGLEEKLRGAEKDLRDVWNHPAIRRLARFNWLGLKFLGLFGMLGRVKVGFPKAAQPAPAQPAPAQPAPAQPAPAQPAPAQSAPAQPAPAQPAKQSQPLHAIPPLGQRPAEESTDPKKHEIDVQGFCRFSNIYGAAHKARSPERIVIDVSRVFDDRLTGVSHFCDQLARALIRVSPHDVLLYSSNLLPRWILDWPGYPQFVHCPPGQRVTDYAQYYKAPAIEELAGPTAAFIDASAVRRVPLLRTHRRLTTIHDIAPTRCPETVAPKAVKLCESYFQWQAKHANMLVADSAYSKKDFCDYTGIPGSWVEVVPVGLDAIFRQPLSDGDCDRVRKKYGLHQDFIS